MMHILHDRCMKDKQRENKIWAIQIMILLHIAAFAFGKRCCKWKVFLKWIVSDFEGTLTTYV